MQQYDTPTLEKNAYKVMVQEIKDIAIFFMNPEGEIVSWNDGAKRIKGYSEEDVLGRNYRMLFTDDDIRNGHPERELGVARKEGRFEAEEIRRRKDGSLFRAHVILTRQMDDGRLLGFFKVTRDVTERYEREKEAIESANEIERLSRLKDEFISIASHELKTPITSIKAYLQLLNASLSPGVRVTESHTDYISKFSRQLAKLEKLIGELLDVSRIGAGKLLLHVESFDFSQLIHETVESLRHSTTTHSFTVSVPADVVARGDRDKLEQVIVNFLTNAVRYSPAGTCIEVILKQKEDRITVAVKDEGKGIPKQEQKKIFNRFYRSEENKHAAAGLGLGLYIVKGIIHQHKGKVGVSSEPGKGACFYFTIPVKEA